MNDNAVFSKLSRILETHAFTTDDKSIDKMIHDYINEDSQSSSPSFKKSSPLRDT